MALFGAYLDESSGELNGVRVLAVAGWVAFADHWDAVAKRWVERLSADVLPEFHMTEYECEVGIFDKREISEPRAKALFNDLLTILETDGLRLQPFGIWTDLNEVPAADAYPQLVLKMCDIVARSVESSDGDVRIAFLADENMQHATECLAAFRNISSNVSVSPYARNIASFGFGKSHLIPHIQIADLLAYEVMKQARNKLVPGAPGGLRYPLRRIIANRPAIPLFQVTTNSAA